MKLNSVEQDVLTNSQNESQFTINASAHAFKILSDGLYQHKIAAIVRELTCNAYDAHVEKGNADEPFKVVLPNSIHPYFEIEDYGIGLDDEGVREVYTSYFTSTKNDSNDSVGAFGLGSKTPFAYTTTFTIRARKNGVERLYNAYLGQTGAPCVNMILERETDGHSGVKITVPVKQGDHESFRYEASFILSFLKTEPNVTDQSFEVIAPGIGKDIEENGMIARRIPISGSSLYTGKVYAVMGGVCYRLDEDWVRNEVDDRYLNRIVLGNRWTYDRPTLFIHFEIGSIEVAASRETLSMDENTRDVIVQTICERVADLKQQDQDLVDQQDHCAKAIKFVADRYGAMHINQFTYNGIRLEHYEDKQIFGKGLWDVDLMTDVRSRAWNQKRVNRAQRFSLGHVSTLGEVHAVYYEKDQKRSSRIKYGRQVTPNKGDGVCLLFNSPMNKHKRDRVEKYLGVDITWHNLQDLKDADLEAGQSGTKRSSGGARLTDTTIRAVSILFDANWCATALRERLSAQINLDCPDTKFVRFRARNGDDVGFVDRDGLCQRGILPQAFRSLGYDKVVLVRQNTINQKKLERFNVETIDDIIARYVESDLSRLILIGVRDVLSFSENERFDFIQKSQLPDYKKYVKETETALGISDDDISDNEMHVGRLIGYLLTDDQQAKFNQHKERRLKMQQVISSRYPLLPYLGVGDHMSDDKEYAVKHYINMVDFVAQS